MGELVQFEWDMTVRKDHIYNPTVTEGKTSTLGYRCVSPTEIRRIVLEAGALQVAENIVSEAVSKAHEATKQVITAINELD